MTQRPARDEYRGADRRSAATAAVAADYRGPDRRTRRAALHLTWVTGPVLWAFVVVVFVFAVMRADAAGGIGSALTFEALRDIGDCLLLLAGSALIVVWALDGRAARALDGSSLILVGAGQLALSGPYGAVLHHDPLTVLVSPACQLAVTLPAIVLLLRSPGELVVDSGVRPGRLFAIAGACSAALLVILGTARVIGPIDDDVLWTIVVAGLLIAWMVVGFRRIATSMSDVADNRERWLGWALVGFGGGNAFIVTALLTHDVRWGVAATEVQLLAAAGVLWVAASWLLEVLRRYSNRTLLLAGELRDTTEVLADEQMMRDQLVHDARNMLAGIRTANGTLERYGQHLDAVASLELQQAVSNEFSRLEQLLDRTPARDLESFDLLDAVTAVVDIARQTGAKISVRVPGTLTVRGRSHETAAVLHALLHNAARHAPGSAVEIWTEAIGSDVRLVVADRGDGVPDADREAVFERAYRHGKRAQTGGLGLFVGRRLMVDQGGGLTLESRPGGGTLAVMTLVLADPRPSEDSSSGAPDGQVPQDIDDVRDPHRPASQPLGVIPAY